MVCARVRRAPSFQHPTRQRQITVFSQSQPLPANKPDEVHTWMMKTHIKNIIHFFCIYVCISNFYLQSPIICLSKSIQSIPIATSKICSIYLFLILPDSRLNFRSSPRLSVSFASSTSKGCSGDDCEVAKGGAKGGAKDGASETEPSNLDEDVLHFVKYDMESLLFSEGGGPIVPPIIVQRFAPYLHHP